MKTQLHGTAQDLSLKTALNNKILSRLSLHMQIIVLRGVDKYSHVGGDIDYMVSPGLSIKACHLAAIAAREAGWHTLYFRDIGYVSSITLVNVNDGISLPPLKLDFINGFAWYSAGIADAISDPFSELWQSVKLIVADNTLPGYITYLQKIMASGRVSLQDWERIQAMELSIPTLKLISKRLSLPLRFKNGDPTTISWVNKWQLRLASCGVVNVLQFIPWILLICYKHIVFKLGLSTKSGVTYSFSGMDGSGKSTIIKSLIDLYSDLSYAKIEVCHFLPSWLPMPHQIIRRKKTVDLYSKPYSEPPVSSRLNGYIRLYYYLVAFIISRFYYFGLEALGYVVILDRSYLDFLADLSRAKIPLKKVPDPIVGLLAAGFVSFYVDAAAETVVRRKNELSLDKASNLRLSYISIANKCGSHILNAEKSQEIVVLEVLSHISEILEKKLLDLSAS